jgi:multidrug efflux pump subunit AcrA (membrane-fusion protein)
MLRQVRGLGTLIPSHEDVRQIPAETEATVIRIVKLPGSLVEPDTVLVEMSNPQLEQEALDAQLQVKAAEAEYQSLKVKLASDLMTQKLELPRSTPIMPRHSVRRKPIKRSMISA